jgi:WD40 repeat protein
LSPDGKRLVSATGDNTLHLWDSETGQELAALHDPLALRLVTGARGGLYVLDQVSVPQAPLVLTPWDLGKGATLLSPRCGKGFPAPRKCWIRTSAVPRRDAE